MSVSASTCIRSATRRRSCSAACTIADAPRLAGPLRRRRGRARGRRRAARTGRSSRSRHALPGDRRRSTAAPTRWRLLAEVARPRRARRVGGSRTSTSRSRPRHRGSRRTSRRWPRTSSRRSAPLARTDGPRHRGVGATQARRRSRRDRPRRGHRGLGRRAAVRRLNSAGRSESGSRPTAPISLAGCCGSTTPRDARRSTSCRASTGAVSMYVCGPTPYDVPHLGHGRKEVVFDTIRRYLMWRGLRGDVREQRHRHRGQDHRPGPRRRARPRPSSSRRYEGTFRDAFDRLNILRPDDEPRATEWIDEMIDADRAARRERARVRRRGPGRLLPGRHAARVRRALAPHARGAARERGRARRRRRAQARAGRLRALEDGQARRAGVGLAVGARPARAGTSSARRCR